MEPCGAPLFRFKHSIWEHELNSVTWFHLNAIHICRMYICVSLQGEDWVVPSSKLKLKQVREQDSGQYTCIAQHPTVSSLIKKRTILLTVLPGQSHRVTSTLNCSITCSEPP